MSLSSFVVVVIVVVCRRKQASRPHTMGGDGVECEATADRQNDLSGPEQVTRPSEEGRVVVGGGRR